MIIYTNFLKNLLKIKVKIVLIVSKIKIMKIAYISNSSAPSHLPSSLQIVKTCEYLTKLKNEVHLILPNTSKFKDTFQNFYNIKYNFKITKN